MTAIHEAREWLLSFGESDGESETDRGRRRILVGAVWTVLFLTLVSLTPDFLSGESPYEAGSTSVIWAFGASAT